MNITTEDDEYVSLPKEFTYDNEAFTLTVLYTDGVTICYADVPPLAIFTHPRYRPLLPKYWLNNRHAYRSDNEQHDNPVAPAPETPPPSRGSVNRLPWMRKASG